MEVQHIDVLEIFVYGYGIGMYEQQIWDEGN